MSIVAAKPRNFWEAIATPRVMFSMLVLYCLCHFLIRLLLSPNFSLDESDLMLFSQSFEWVYRFRNPSLMNWMAWAVLDVSGGSRVAVFLLKYAIMAAGFMAYYAGARAIIRDNRLAAFAVLGIITTFTFGYLAHINFTHSVLMGSATAGFLWAFARTITKGKFADYLILGIATGIGMLSKYIFGLLPIAFAIAVLLTPAIRTRVKPLLMLAAAAVAAAIFAPYMWIASSQKYSLMSLAKSVTKGTGPQASLLAWLKGIGNYLVTLFDFIAPFFPVATFVFWRACKPLPQGAGDEMDRGWHRMLGLAMLASGLLMLTAVLYLGAEELNQRWIYPVLMPFPVWFFLRVKMAGRSPLSDRIFAICAGVFALAVVIARPAVYFTDAAHCKKCREYWPMTSYATSLARAGFYRGTVVASTYDLGGSLRYVMPDSRVVTPGYPVSVFGKAKGGQCLIVWRGHGDMPKAEADYVAGELGAKVSANSVRGDVMAPLVTDRGRMDTLSYILLPSGSGRCN